MRDRMLVLLVCLILSGCGRASNDQRDQGSSGSGVIYNRGGANEPVRAGASSTATDLRPTGGSLAGAGGAGPGYDGSGKGEGKNRTIPAPGAGFGASLTNSDAATNRLAQTNSPTTGK